jgi:membrane-anchored protein YejM (alkaline phosphatase superfamily)
LRNPSFSLFFKANLFLTTLLFLGFLVHFKGYGFSNLLFAIIATISSATLLAIIFYIISIPFSFIKNWGIKLLALLFILANIALIIDFFVYKLFHFHINAMVLNILTSPDAMDSIQAGVTPFIALALAIMALVYFEIVVYKKINSISNTHQVNLNQKLNKLIILPLFLILLTDKLGFGFASLFSKNTIIAPIKVIPLYQPLTFTKIAAKHFGFKAEEQAKYSIKTDAALNYPLVPLKIKQTISTFPIFIIALDSVKYTAITPELTPNISTFSKDALVLKHHFSGGNSTRFGIFSLMYGLNATYWFSFLHANQKPLLFDVLQKRGYDINIFSSTNTNWPEFRKTCYVAIQDKIQDSFKGEPWKKDAQSSQCFIDQINTYNSSKPLFNFIFLDAPHGYSYPPDANIYNAEGGEVNYLSITPNSQELETVEKRYKNALHYNDKLVGKMLETLKAKGLYDDALILFTSDHGQEFFEYGNFGHNTSFSLSQAQVPMLIKLPKSMQHLTSPNGITSHQDIVPTLLSMLGVSNPSSNYSNGQNIFASDYHRDYTFCANWNNNAILTSETISVFSNLPNKMFGNEVRDTQSYEKLPNVKPKSKFILDTMNENKKFLK